MKNYNEFINSRINEEAEFGGTKAAKGIGGLFKNLLGGLLNDVKDELKKPLEDFNKKLGNQKDISDMTQTVNKYLLQHRDTLVKSMEDAKTLPDVLSIVDDNLKTAYASIGASIKNFGKETYTFDELFKDAPERTKKLFSKDTKRFDKNAEQFSKDLILSLGKPYKIEKEDLEQTPEDAKDENDQDQVQKAATGDENKKNEKLHKNYKNKLFEKIDEDNLSKLKETIINWFDDTIYKNVKKKMDDVKNNKEESKEVNIEAKIEEIPADVTNNKDSVKDILSKITELDKETLIQVRDLIGLNKEDTPL